MECSNHEVEPALLLIGNIRTFDGTQQCHIHAFFEGKLSVSSNENVIRVRVTESCSNCGYQRCLEYRPPRLVRKIWGWSKEVIDSRHRIRIYETSNRCAFYSYKREPGRICGSHPERVLLDESFLSREKAEEFLQTWFAF